jgi:hypothetical protein
MSYFTGRPGFFRELAFPPEEAIFVGDDPQWYGRARNVSNLKAVLLNPEEAGASPIV